jgi:hypothetical protein
MTDGADVIELQHAPQALEVTRHSGLGMVDAIRGLKLSGAYFAQHGTPPQHDAAALTNWLLGWLRQIGYAEDGRSGLGLWKAAVWCCGAIAADAACNGQSVEVVRGLCGIVKKLAHALDDMERSL